MSRKVDFCICKNKYVDQLRSNLAADQRLCLCYLIVRSLLYVNPKFQVPSHLLWLYSLVCVGPGQKLRKPVFSQRGSNGSSKMSTKSACLLIVLYGKSSVTPSHASTALTRSCFHCVDTELINFPEHHENRKKTLIFFVKWHPNSSPKVLLRSSHVPTEFLLAILCTLMTLSRRSHLHALR